MSDLDAWLQGQDTDYLQCRDLRHDETVASVRRTRHGFERIIVCQRCERFRIQTITRSGMLERTVTRYPSGYLRPKGSGPLTTDERAALRLRTLRTQLKDQKEDDR